MPLLAPGEPALLAARAALRHRAADLLVWESAATRGKAESIHQLRVSIRRLRATLYLFASLLPAQPRAALLSDLNWLATTTGRVRDLDVALESIERRAHKLDRAMASQLAPLERLAREMRAAEFLRFLRALRTRRCESMASRLATIADGPVDGATLGSLAASLLSPLLRAMTRAGREVNLKSEPRNFHRLRVRAKRVRYALELLRPLGARATKKMLRRLEDVQEVFGAYQDVLDALLWMRAHAESEALPAATMVAAGAIIYRLEARERKLRSRALERWTRFGRGGIIRAALGELRTPQPPQVAPTTKDDLT